jgi:Bifunctional DNA primase/polymerase, N-terminal
VIRAWWEQWPTANVAIATESDSVDVLDVDVKPGGTGYPALERLRQVGLLRDGCARVRTRSGGLHLYFRPNGQGNSTLPGHYLDLRGIGPLVPQDGSDERSPAGRGVARAALELQ